MAQAQPTTDAVLRGIDRELDAFQGLAGVPSAFDAALSSIDEELAGFERTRVTPPPAPAPSARNILSRVMESLATMTTQGRTLGAAPAPVVRAPAAAPTLTAEELRRPPLPSRPVLAPKPVAIGVTARTPRIGPAPPAVQPAPPPATSAGGWPTFVERPPGDTALFARVLATPIEGVAQVARGTKALFTLPPVVPTEIPGQAAPVPPETMDALSDVMEGTFKALTVVLPSAAVRAPLVLAVTIGTAEAASLAATAAAKAAGVGAEAQRLAGNVAAALSVAAGGGELVRRVSRRTLFETARVVTERGVPPEPEARVITPEPTDIEVRPVRPALPAEGEVGIPRAPGPEPPPTPPGVIAPRPEIGPEGPAVLGPPLPPGGPPPPSGPVTAIAPVVAPPPPAAVAAGPSVAAQLYEAFRKEGLPRLPDVEALIERVSIGTPAPAAPILKAGDRVVADEGAGTVHQVRDDAVRIALEPDGKLSKWIPTARVTLAPLAPVATTAPAPTVRGRLTVERIFSDRIPTEPAARLAFLEREYQRTPDVSGLRTTRQLEVVQDEIRRLTALAEPSVSAEPLAPTLAAIDTELQTFEEVSHAAETRVQPEDRRVQHPRDEAVGPRVGPSGGGVLPPGEAGLPQGEPGEVAPLAPPEEVVGARGEARPMWEFSPEDATRLAHLRQIQKASTFKRKKGQPPLPGLSLVERGELERLQRRERLARHKKDLVEASVDDLVALVAQRARAETYSVGDEPDEFGEQAQAQRDDLTTLDELKARGLSMADVVDRLSRKTGMPADRSEALEKLRQEINDDTGEPGRNDLLQVDYAAAIEQALVPSAPTLQFDAELASIDAELAAFPGGEGKATLPTAPAGRTLEVEPEGGPEPARPERPLAGRRPAAARLPGEPVGGPGGGRPEGLEGEQPPGAPTPPGVGEAAPPRRAGRPGDRVQRVRGRTPLEGPRRPDPGRDRAGAVGHVETATLADTPEVRVAHTRGESPRTFTIDETAALTEGGWPAKLEDNLAALRLLKALQRENRMASAAEQAVLARYIGWGHTNLAPVVDPRGLEERRDPRQKQAREELERLLTADELRELGESTVNAHYSFVELPRTMWAILERMGFKGGSVLEPAVGTGHFFGTMPPAIRAHKRTRLFAVDKEPIAAAITRQLYQDAYVQASPLQSARLPEHYFDVVISNVPFGKIEVFDPTFVAPARALMTRSLHNYYFGKALDLVRPGGLVAFVTSRYTMDSEADAVRRYVAGRAKLVGAFRLPKELFLSTAGTEVVTDVLVLQRLDATERPGGEAWFEAVKRDDLGQRWDSRAQVSRYIHTNEYYKAHPDRIVGQESRQGSMYGGSEYTVSVGEGGISPDRWQTLVEAFPAGVYRATSKPPRKLVREAAVDAKQGSFVVEKGRLYLLDKGTLVPSPLKGRGLQRALAFVPLRDAYQAVLDVMLANGSDADLTAAQMQLRRTYDAFVRAHGHVNLSENKRIIQKDPNGARIIALEDAEVLKAKGRAPILRLTGLAPIFTTRTIKPIQEPTSAASASDALVQSLAWRGQVDLAYMSSLTGLPADALVQGLSGDVYRDPATNGWVPKDEYLSGDVVTKLAQAEAGATLDPSLQANVDALRAVQPDALTADDFTAPFGATWVPVATYEQFLRDEAKTDVTLRLVNNENRTHYYVEAGGTRYELVPEGQDFAAWVADALNGALPTIKQKDADGKEYTDHALTERYRESLVQLRERWDGWWRGNAEAADHLTQIYNAMFNREVPRAFDGAHLVIPNSNPDIGLRPWQKNSVWRILQAGNTYIAHAVGAGKTYVLVAAAGEMRRLGLANKPMIVSPNHLVEQTRRAFVYFYPGARILVPAKEDFERERRKALTARIANNDWDAIIMAQSQFLRVSVKAATIKAFVQEQEAQLLAEGANQLGISVEDFTTKVDTEPTEPGGKSNFPGRSTPRSVKDIVRTILRLRARLQKRLDQQKKDEPISFEELGVDALLVDEAHEYKNLFFSTSRNNIAGLKGSEAGRAMDMYMKVRLTNQASKNRNVVFASGTPIDNAMSELYTIFRYLAQPDLDRLGMPGFDAWANNYAVATSEHEAAAGGGYKERIRLRQWNNLRELSGLFRRFADVLTTEELIASGVVKLPALKGGARTTIALEPHPQMGAFMEELRDRLEALKSGKVDPRDDNYLKIATEASLSAIDMRLVDPTAPEDPNGRIPTAAREIVARYKAHEASKGTQLIFLDVGIPKTFEPLPRSVTAEQTGEELIQTDEEPADEDTVDVEAEDEAELDVIRAAGEMRNLYGDLRRRLVEGGIPPDEIVYIHQAKDAVEQAQLFRAMQTGRVRVMFATTAKGATGMNVQQRLVAEHHLDAPWKPAALEQREGRILRQGNENDEIEIIRYVTKRSFDEYRWGLLSTKQGFIHRFYRGELSTLDDVDPAQLDMQVAQALASGDPRVLDMLNKERDVRGLRARYANWSRRRQRAQQKVAWAKTFIDEHEPRVADFQQALALAQAWEQTPTVTLTASEIRWGRSGQLAEPVAYAWKDTEARKAFQAAIERLMESGVPYETQAVGEAGPFLLTVDRTEVERAVGTERTIDERATLSVRLTFGQYVDLGHAPVVGVTPTWDPDAPPDYRRSLDSYLRSSRIADLISQEQRGLTNARAAVAEEAAIAAKPFDKAAELKAAEDALHELRLAIGVEKAVAATVGEEAPERPADEGTRPEGEDAAGVSAMRGPPPPLPPPSGAAQPVTERMRPSAIIANLEIALQRILGKTPVSTGGFRQRAGGIFKEGPRAIRMRVANDLQTYFHERGHQIAQTLLKIRRKDRRWKAELRALGMPTSRPSYTVDEVLKEGEAEFLRQYLLDPTALPTAAPTYFAEFERKLSEHPDLKSVLEEARRDVEGLISQDPATRGRLRIDFTGGPSGFFRRMVQDPGRALRDFMADWVDDLWALKWAVDRMADGRPLPLAENAHVLARIARGSAGTAEAFITREEAGVVGPNGQQLGPALATAMRTVGPERLRAWAEYLVARHAVEVHDNRPGINPGLSRDEADAITRQVELGPDAVDFERAAGGAYAFQDAVLEYVRQWGGISAERIALFRQVYRYYVPLQRVIEEGADFAGTARRIANRRAPFMRRFGSGRDVVNPLESIVKNTFALVDFAQKNAAMIALADQVDRTPGSAWIMEKVDPMQAKKVLASRVVETLGDDAIDALEQAGIDPEQLVTIFSPDLRPKPGRRYVTVVRGDETEVYQVHDPQVYDAITYIGAREVGAIIETLQKPAQLLRATATLTPGFVARNPTRDTLVAWFQSQYGFIPGWDTARGLLSQIMDDEHAQQFFARGIQMATLAAQDRQQRREVLDRIEREGVGFWQRVVINPVELVRALHPILRMQQISGAMEVATRLGEFRLVREAGGRPQSVVQRILHAVRQQPAPAPPPSARESFVAATWAARNVSLDFSRAGRVGREMNRAVAFFNAQVQGFARATETFAKNPVGTMLKLALLGLFTYLLWWLNFDEEEYQNIPDWQKNAYWHIPLRPLQLVGLSGFIKIPKPFEWGLTADVMEAVLTLIATEQPEALKRIRPRSEDLWGMLWAVMPTAIMPLVEAGMNYDSFRDTNIVKPWDVERLDTNLQFSDWTSETAKRLAEILPMAPAKIDHLIYGYTAGMGRGVVSWGLDPALRAAGRAPSKVRPTTPTEKWPVVGVFYESGGYDGGSQDLADFYDTYQQIVRAQASARELGKSSVEAQRARIQEAEAQIPAWSRRGAMLNARKRLADLSEEVNRLYASSVMTPAQKRERLDRVYERMVDIARWGLGRPALRQTAVNER